MHLDDALDEIDKVAEAAWTQAESRDKAMQITRYDLPALQPIPERDTVAADIFTCLALLVLAVLVFTCAGIVALVLR